MLWAHRVVSNLQTKLIFLFDRNLQNYLRHIEGFLAENFAKFFPPLQSLVLVGQVDHLHKLINIFSQVQVDHLYKLVNMYFWLKRSKVPTDPRIKFFCIKLLSNNYNNIFVLHIYIHHVAAMMLSGISVEEKIKRKWQREILLKRKRKIKNFFLTFFKNIYIHQL